LTISAWAATDTKPHRAAASSKVDRVIGDFLYRIMLGFWPVTSCPGRPGGMLA
jgi:hypothetical protein